jgi:hypothetical protein
MLRVPCPAGSGQRWRHRADRAAPRPRCAVWRARADRGARARSARSPPPATGLTPRPGPPAVRPQRAPAVVAPTADPGIALTPAGHRVAGELHRSNDAGGLVRRAGCPPCRYRVATPGQQPRCAPACRATPRRRPSRKRRQSHRLRDARSRSRAAAWPQAGQPAPEEEIVVTAGTPHARPAARQAHDANNHRRGPGNGRASISDNQKENHHDRHPN